MAPTSNPLREVPFNDDDNHIHLTVGRAVATTTQYFTTRQLTICFYSGKYETFLAGNEDKEKHIDIPEAEPWLYSHLFLFMGDRSAFEEFAKTTEPAFDFGKMAKLWVFGGSLDIPLLQNACMDILIEYMLKTPLEFLKNIPQAFVTPWEQQNPLERLLALTWTQINRIGASHQMLFHIQNGEAAPGSMTPQEYEKAAWDQMDDARWQIYLACGGNTQGDLSKVEGPLNNRWLPCSWHIHTDIGDCGRFRYALDFMGRRVVEDLGGRKFRLF